MFKKILILAASFVLAKIVNELAYTALAPYNPNQGVWMPGALIPAVLGSSVIIFGIYFAFKDRFYMSWSRPEFSKNSPIGTSSVGSGFNDWGKLALVIIVAVFGYAVYDSKINSTNSSASKSTRQTFSTSPLVPQQVSIFRKLGDGVLMRWSNDKECFINMTIDFSRSAIPVSLSKTNELKSQFFKELTQENLVIAVLYYDPNLSDDTVTKFINKDIFLKIKSMCQ